MDSHPLNERMHKLCQCQAKREKVIYTRITIKIVIYRVYELRVEMVSQHNTQPLMTPRESHHDEVALNTQGLEGDRPKM